VEASLPKCRSDLERRRPSLLFRPSGHRTPSWPLADESNDLLAVRTLLASPSSWAISACPFYVLFCNIRHHPHRILGAWRVACRDMVIMIDCECRNNNGFLVNGAFGTRRLPMFLRIKTRDHVPGAAKAQSVVPPKVP